MILSFFERRKSLNRLGVIYNSSFDQPIQSELDNYFTQLNLRELSILLANVPPLAISPSVASSPSPSIVNDHPPEYEDALRCPTKESFILEEEEESPPTYQDYCSSVSEGINYI